MLTRLRSFSTEALRVINNVAKQQFVVALRTAQATIDYEEKGKIITLLHTNVPQEFQGKGVGKILGKHAFDYALQNNLEVTCKCHFLAKYYEDNINNYKGLKVKFLLD